VIALPTAYLVGPAQPDEPADPPVAIQLRELGFAVVETPTVEAALEALDPSRGHRTPADEAAVLVDRRFVGHLHALRRATYDSRSQILVGPGTLRVAPEARPQLLTALDVASPSDAPVDIAAVAAALRTTGTVTAFDPAPLVAGIADSAAEREALQGRVASVDEERVRLASSVKSNDTLFTTFFVRTYSGHAARLFARLGLRPNHVTALSLVVALAAAAAAATGTRASFVAAAVLFHLSFVLDCVDGDLARYTVRFSRLGARLDLTADRIKEYALFAGLAVGAAGPAGGGWSATSVWILAATAMAFQTVRHQMHFAYDEVTADLDSSPPLSELMRTRLAGGRWKVWLRRAVVLPQGERSALICLLVAFTTPPVVFIVLLAAGVAAATYAFLGRFMRSLRRLHEPWSKSAGRALGAMVDIGPIGWIFHHALPGRALPAPLTTLIALVVLAFSLIVVPAVGSSWLIVGMLWYALLAGFATQQPLNGWADWVLPPSFRAAEYALAITLTALIAPDALPVAFGYVAACAYHHYDTVYRLRESHTTPRWWLLVATGGHDGRMVVLGLLAIGGAQVFTVGLGVLAVGLGALYVIESLVSMTTEGRTRPTTATLQTAGDAR